MPAVAEARLSKDADLPLYAQLYGILRGQVLRGELAPGDLIPAESVLVATYGVSRITVRTALEQLVQDGLIDRRRGRGSFVRPPPRSSRAPAWSPSPTRCCAPGASRARASPVWRAGGRGSSASRPRRSRPRTCWCASTACAWSTASRPRSCAPSCPTAGSRGSARRRFEQGAEQSLLFVLERRYGLPLDQGEETVAPGTIAEPFASLLGVTGQRGPREDLRGARRRRRGDAVRAVVLVAPQTQLVRRVAPSG